MRGKTHDNVKKKNSNKRDEIVNSRDNYNNMSARTITNNSTKYFCTCTALPKQQRICISETGNKAENPNLLIGIKGKGNTTVR